MKAVLLFRKDLRILRRSPALVAILVAYPMVIAVLIGLTATYASAKPRVALVDRDGLPPTVVIAGRAFSVQEAIDEVSKNVRLVRMPLDQAERELANGEVVGVLEIPPGFLATLKSLVSSPKIVVRTGRGGIAPRAKQQLQALVFNLNRRLQKAFIEADIRYVDLLLKGGKGDVLGRPFEVLGLEGVARLLETMPRGPKLDAIRDFVDDARQALALTDEAIRATAHPIEIEEPPERGRTWALSAEVQGYALALTITFLGLLLAAGSIAAERDENVIGRLARGLVGLGELVWAKMLLTGAVSLAIGLAIAIAFGVVVDVGGVTGGEPWERLPLLALGLALAGASIGAIGALIGGLAREARTASLAAILVVMPIVFVGLVPREIVPPAGWISTVFPFVHAVRFFTAALFDASPWATLGREAAWLAGLGLGFGVLGRVGARRLLV